MVTLAIDDDGGDDGDDDQDDDGDDGGDDYGLGLDTRGKDNV